MAELLQKWLNEEVGLSKVNRFLYLSFCFNSNVKCRKLQTSKMILQAVTCLENFCTSLINKLILNSFQQSKINL